MTLNLKWIILQFCKVEFVLFNFDKRAMLHSQFCWSLLHVCVPVGVCTCWEGVSVCDKYVRVAWGCVFVCTCRFRCVWGWGWGWVSGVRIKCVWCVKGTSVSMEHTHKWSTHRGKLSGRVGYLSYLKIPTQHCSLLNKQVEPALQGYCHGVSCLSSGDLAGHTAPLVNCCRFYYPEPASHFWERTCVPLSLGLPGCLQNQESSWCQIPVCVFCSRPLFPFQVSCPIVCSIPCDSSCFVCCIPWLDNFYLLHQVSPH